MIGCNSETDTSFTRTSDLELLGLSDDVLSFEQRGFFEGELDDDTFYFNGMFLDNLLDLSFDEDGFIKESVHYDKNEFVLFEKYLEYDDDHYLIGFTYESEAYGYTIEGSFETEDHKLIMEDGFADGSYILNNDGVETADGNVDHTYDDGLLVEIESNFADYNRLQYDYNSSNMIKHVTLEDYGSLFEIDFKYQKNLVNKMTVTYPSQVEATYRFDYTFDDHNNWTEMLVITEEEEVLYTYERVYTYK